jgi:hypothetical protein
MRAVIELYELISEVTIYAPAVAEPVAVRYLREAARDICQAGKLWKETDQIKINDPEYQGICSVQDSSIVEITDPQFEGLPLQAVTPGWLDMEFPRWSGVSETSVPRFVTQIAPNTLTLYPRSTGTLTARLTLQPSRDAQTIPAFLAENYATELGKGAAGRILLLPGENANPQFGAGLIGEFQAVLDRLRTGPREQQDVRRRTRGSFF